MIEAAVEFCSRQDNQLKEIRFVNIDDETVKYFEDEFMVRFENGTYYYYYFYFCSWFSEVYFRSPTCWDRGNVKKWKYF